jgi:hypothetical protein
MCPVPAGELPSSWWQSAVAPEVIRLGGCTNLGITLDALWGDVSLSSWANSLKVLDLSSALTPSQALPAGWGGMQYLQELRVRDAAGRAD